MLAIEALGLFGIIVMVGSYALEKRDPIYIAIFSGGCAVSAVYALLIQSYPFLIAESIWAVVAFRRWRGAVGAL